MYGLVEGFISKPLDIWSNEERLVILNYIVKNCSNFNCYFYCPKGDRYVLGDWDKRYPDISSLKEIVDICIKNKIKFVYGLNPDFDVKFVEDNFDEYIGRIVYKLNQFVEIGVNNFCILFDEVSFSYDLVNGVKNSNERKIGQLHVKIMNKLNETFENLWFCASDYFFTKETDYVLELKKLNKNISLIWTGDGVWTKRITTKMYERALKISSHKLVYWDNYPVNDDQHCLNTFHIGGFNDPECKIENILINPMREAYANFLVLDTFNQYLEGNYNRDKNLFYNESVNRLYTSFSNKNVVDDRPRGYFVGKVNLDLIKEDLKVFKGLVFVGEEKLFFEVTSNIIKCAEDFLDIVERGKNNGYFDAFSFFIQERFMRRIFNVLKERIALTCDVLGKEIFVNKLKRLEEIYELNKNRSEITFGDEFCSIAKELIDEDRKMFMKGIRDLSVDDKVKFVVKRHYINGY